MAAEQLNLRVRDGLDRQVRLHAALHGASARDVVEDALVVYGFRREGQGVDPGALSLPRPGVASRGPAPVPAGGNGAGAEASVAAEAPAPGCPECGGTVATDGLHAGVVRCVDCGWQPAPPD